MALSKEDGWTCQGSFFGSKGEVRGRRRSRWGVSSPSPGSGESRDVLEKEQEADAELLWAVYALADEHRGNVGYLPEEDSREDRTEERDSCYSRLLAQSMFASQAQEMLRKRRRFFPAFIWKMYTHRRNLLRGAAILRIVAGVGIATLFLTAMVGALSLLDGVHLWMLALFLSVGASSIGISVAAKQTYSRSYRKWAKGHPVEVRMSIAALVREHRTIVCGIESTRPEGKSSRVRYF